MVALRHLSRICCPATSTAVERATDNFFGNHDVEQSAIFVVQLLALLVRKLVVLMVIIRCFTFTATAGAHETFHFLDFDLWVDPDVHVGRTG